MLNINLEEIRKSDIEFWKQTKCPYSKAVQYINEIQKNSTPNVVNKIGNFIINLFKGGEEERINKINEFSGRQKVDFLSRYKLDKYIVDIILLQEEIYKIISNILNPNYVKNKSNLATLSLTKQLHLEQERESRWSQFIYFIQMQSLHNFLWRENKNRHKDIYREYQKLSMNYIHMAKWQQYSIASVFAQWVSDGAWTCWNIVNVIPTLYFAKYNKFPSKEEYRTIAEKNAYAILIPMATLELSDLTTVAREYLRRDSSMYVSESEQYKARKMVNNWLDISPMTAELDEQNNIIINKNQINSIKARSEKSVYTKINTFWGLKNISNIDPLVRIGCPSLRAKNENWKPMIQAFINDMFILLDEIYFPYRERSIKNN